MKTRMQFELGTEKKIAAPAARLTQMLTSIEGVQAWWREAGLPVKKESGPDSGVGLVLSFESDGQVTERWTLEQVDPVLWAVEFVGFGGVRRTFTLTPGADGTVVRWHETGSSPHQMTEEEREQTQGNFQMALGLLARAAAR